MHKTQQTNVPECALALMPECALLCLNVPKCAFTSKLQNELNGTFRNIARTSLSLAEGAGKRWVEGQGKGRNAWRRPARSRVLPGRGRKQKLQNEPTAILSAAWRARATPSTIPLAVPP